MANFEILDGDDWIVIKKDGQTILSEHSVQWSFWKKLLEQDGHHVSVQFGQFGEIEDDINDGNTNIFTTLPPL
jgi:hypothetical protein